MDTVELYLWTLIIIVLGGMIGLSILWPFFLILFVPIILFVCLVTMGMADRTEDQSNEENSEPEEQSGEEIAEPEEQANEEVSEPEEQVSEEVNEPEEQANEEDNEANDKTEPWAIILGFSFIALGFILGIIAHL